MRPADAHLSQQELELLLFGDTGSETKTSSGAALPEANLHLKGCEVCQSMAKKYEKADEVLRNIRPQKQAAAGPNCPPEDVWPDLAVGLLDQPAALQFAEHAAGCDWCGRLLREAGEVLTDELTEAEQTMLAQRSTASKSGQRELAQWLAARSGGRKVPEQKSDKPGFIWWLRWAAAASVVLAAASWWGWTTLRQPSVEQLLAQAYTEQRPFEMRVPGAAYGPVREQRGGSGPRVAQSAALLEALSKLAKQRSGRLRDPTWLSEEGRAELLFGDYTNAVHNLERAHQFSPLDDNVEIDLASALFQRSSAPGFEDDLPQALDLLREVTARNPQSSMAWFNLALVSERMQALTEALDVWDTYLKIDSSSGWAAEARERREAIQERLKRYKQKSSLPVDPPEVIAERYQRDSSAEIEVIDQRPELYLDVATSSWLPHMSRLKLGSEEESSIKQVSEIVAQVALQHHGDAWLHDMITVFDGSSKQRSAIIALARSQALSDAGDYAGSRIAARQSAHLSEVSNLMPGLLRARYQDIYVSHFLQEADVCLRDAQNLMHELEGRSYTWLSIQTDLEAAICANMMGRMNAAKAGVSLAIDLAQKHNYGVLYLRSVALSASLEWTSGDFSAATRLANAGLARFWSGAYPSMRGYGLYTVLDSITADSQEWFAQVSVGREATTLIADDGDHAMLAFECQRVANAALQTGQVPIAEQFLKESKRHFAMAPVGDTLDLLRSAAQLGMARVETAKGDFSSAARHLRDVEPWVPRANNRFFQMDFYLAQSDAFLGLGQNHEAEEASIKAVEIAERGLSSISGERDRIVWTRAYDRSYRALVRFALARDTLEAFERWEWYKSAPLRVSRHIAGKGPLPRGIYGQASQKAGRTIALGDGDAALVSYVLLQDQVGAWYQDSNRTVFFKLAIPPHDLTLLVQEFAEQCADWTSDEQKLAFEQRRLYDLLIGPLAALVRSHKRLLIETDGMLDAIAFEALADPDGKLLGDEIEIALSPGKAYISAARAVLSAGVDRHVLVAGNITLADAEREAREIVRLMPGARLLLGSDANSAAILGAISYADIFHYVGHALLARDGSGLLLGQIDSAGVPDVLDAVRLGRAKIYTTKLVVLSACGTAGNGMRTLGEPSSLARVFLATGVPQVIASRWPVDSAATKDLIESFYHHLQAGRGVNAALRLARQEVRSQQRYSHPYYWAAFSVFGKV
ncbi:MAG TPA: CHAT domain-containing protein [Candidatus Saccharimonadales bacterium]|jgi:CHAT domain-containing protein|nr:CHAT domain-containing protein [Candidatus Saccharimonadales bacterium]